MGQSGGRADLTDLRWRQIQDGEVRSDGSPWATEMRDCTEPWEDEYAAELAADWKAKLPVAVGLCPEPSHAEDFYVPLDSPEPKTCPVCSVEMVIYERKSR